MNKKFQKIGATALTALMISCMSMPTITSFAASTTPKAKVPLNIASLKLPKHTYVADVKQIDVNNDKIKDYVILTGVKQAKNDLFYDKLSLLVQDGKTKKVAKTTIGKNGYGYMPELFMGDFNGDKRPDTLISAPTGGSGGIIQYALYSLNGKAPKALFNMDKFNEGIDVTGTFTKGFMASLKSKDLNMSFDLDLSNRKNDYIEANVFDKDGNVPNDKEMAYELGAYGYSMMTPVDMDKNGVYELQGVQRIVGFCNADTLGYINSTWKYADGAMQLDKSKVSLVHSFAAGEADMTGDGVKDFYELEGTSNLNVSSTYNDKITISILDGKTNAYTTYPVAKESAGYTPRIAVEDLNGDNIMEVLVSIPSGGSGGMESESLLSFKNGKEEFLIDDSFNRGFEYTVQFKENFKVDVSVKNDKTYTLDISNMKDIYTTLKVYDKTGKLLQPTEGMRNPVSYAEIKTIDGKKKLLTTQRVIGTSNAETLGHIVGTWGLVDNTLKLEGISVK